MQHVVALAACALVLSIGCKSDAGDDDVARADDGAVETAADAAPEDAAIDSAAEDAMVDVADAHDEAADGEDIALTCDNVAAAFEALSTEQGACSTDDDCVIVWTIGTCDCAPSLGYTCAAALAAGYDTARLDTIVTALGGCGSSCGGAISCMCDCLTPCHAYCDGGRCRATCTGSCIAPPDAGG